MDKYEKGKLKVLVKMLLIHNSPEYLSARQLASKINEYDWGFRSSVTSHKISKLLRYELSKGQVNFMKNIESKKCKDDVMLFRFIGSKTPC